MNFANWCYCLVASELSGWCGGSDIVGSLYSGRPPRCTVGGCWVGDQWSVPSVGAASVAVITSRLTYAPIQGRSHTSALVVPTDHQTAATCRNMSRNIISYSSWSPREYMSKIHCEKPIISYGKKTSISKREIHKCLHKYKVMFRLTKIIYAQIL